ncbi:exopolysaccharide biosynthesis protein [Sporichthya polymorpha]|uniref:exopolysaccharide biosynthesis protein n=1 Tax=Sporichthya polymorpha TaxID=35751 RepID=UPI000371F24F|nr:exopolysaccharide biosynthesis protein [Sporichthya polymorpha]
MTKPRGATPEQATPERALSDRLDAWLGDDQPKTLGGLLTHFGQQAFAVAFVLLMMPSALPIPTAGVTHVLEAATLLIALQLVVGRDEPWLPRRVRDKELKSLQSAKARRRLVTPLQKVEKVARPRFARTVQSNPGRIVFGLVVVVFVIGALAAPPFSGLDTLPSAGIVLVSLGVLFGDAILVGVGLLVGAGGIGLMIALAGTVASAMGSMV